MSVSAALIALAFLALGLPREARAGGLRCSMGEVVIENLKIAQTYSLETLANLPLTIVNTGDRAVGVRVDPLVPGLAELRGGAEPIPDIAWVRAEPDSFVLAAGESRPVELFLTIPDDERLFGKKLQVQFWSHSLPGAGDLVAAGLTSRLIFTIDRAREASGAVPVGDLSLSLLPPEITLAAAEPGRVYRLEEISPGPLRVGNTSKHPVTVQLAAMGSAESGTLLPPGYKNLIGAAEVRLDEPRILLAPGEEKTVTGTVVFPEKEAAGGEFGCILCATVTDMPVTTRIYSRLYARISSAR